MMIIYYDAYNRMILLAPSVWWTSSCAPQRGLVMLHAFLASTVRYLECSLLLLVNLASDLPVHTIKLRSVLLGLLVDACHKQDSLMSGSLHHKRISMLSAINYSTVKIVDDTLPVIKPKPDIGQQIVTFA